MKILVSHIGKAIEKLELGNPVLYAGYQPSAVMTKVGGMPFPEYCRLSCDVRPPTF